MDQKVLYFKEGIMIEVRFFCDNVPLYWHKHARSEGNSTGSLSELQYLNGKRGELIFEANQDYQAYYMYDETEEGYFALIALSPHLGEAFKIYRRRVPPGDILYFIRDYRPKRVSEIKYPIVNL